MRLHNESAYPVDIMKRVAIWSLSDLTQPELDLLGHWKWTFQNMPTNWDINREEGITYNDGHGFIYLRNAYTGHPLYHDVWEAVVDVTRHEIEHGLIFEGHRAYLDSQRAQAAEAAQLAGSSSVSEAAPTGPTEIEKEDPVRLARIEAVADEVVAKIEAEEEAQCERAGLAKLDEWRELAPFERDQVKFGKLIPPAVRWS